jgi:hypothetical protein
MTKPPTLCPICGRTSRGTSIEDPKQLAQLLIEEFQLKLCAEDKRRHKNGFVALIEVQRLVPEPGQTDPEEMVRTGVVCHVRRRMAEKILQRNIPKTTPFMYCELGAFDLVRAMQAGSPKVQPLMSLKSG